MSNHVHVQHYLERHPVRAGMIVHAGDYPWFSEQAHNTWADPEKQRRSALINRRQLTMSLMGLRKIPLPSEQYLPAF